MFMDKSYMNNVSLLKFSPLQGGIGVYNLTGAIKILDY